MTVASTAGAGRGTVEGGDVLAVPDGRVVAEISRRRLARQLAVAGRGVVGVAAHLGELLPGASHRTHAERAALLPQQPLDRETADPSSSSSFDAVLLRHGTSFELVDDGVAVGSGPVLVDRGAAVHDPWRPLGPSAPASPLGRSPFPHRPLVLFLGFEDDPDLADWVRRSVNDLVRRSTEGRIALPAPTAGLHLTRPCAPTAASVAALVPDVVVALDEGALDRSSAWLGDDRSAVVIHLTHDMTDSIELVSWRVGAASGRLRARIGRGVQPTALEALVRRLCAGPQPLPPGERRPGLRVRRSRGSTPPTPVVTALLGGAPTPGDRLRFEALADHAGDAAHVAVRALRPATRADALAADIVVLRGVSDDAGALELVRERTNENRATVVDVCGQDLAPRRPSDGDAPQLTDHARELVLRAGLATTTLHGLQPAMAGLGVRALVVPVLLPLALGTALRALRQPPGSHGDVVLALDAPAAGLDEATMHVIAGLLDRRPRLRIELVDRNGRAAGPDGIRLPERLTRRTGAVAPQAMARWSAHVVAPGPITDSEGRDRAVLEALHLGIPTAVAVRRAQRRANGLVPETLWFDPRGGAEAWKVITPLLDDPSARAEAAEEAVRRTDALHAPTMSTAVVRRFVGWVDARGTRP